MIELRNRCLLRQLLAKRKTTKSDTFWPLVRLIGMRVDFSSVATTERFELGEPVRIRRGERVDSRELKKQLSTKTGRVPHRKRPSVKSSDGVLVTWKLKDGIPSLRQKRVMREFEKCFRTAKERFGLKLMTYTVMSNHLHLVVIAEDDGALRKGLQGLGIRLAKAVNRLFARRGKVFVERFHARALRGLQAVKHAVRYALQNARKHGLPIPKDTWDPFSSARFNMCLARSAKERSPVVLADPFDFVYHGLRLLNPNDCPGLRRHFDF